MRKVTALAASRWLVVLAIFGAMFVVACGGDDDDDGGDPTTAPTNGAESPTEGEGESPTEGEDGETPTTAPTEGEGDGPQSGGEITVHYLEFQSFDPHFSSFSQDIGQTGFVFRGLYKLDADNNVVPEMAASDADISDDGLTVTVALQDGLTWSDGDDLTAEDFVLAIHRTCNPDNGGQYQYLLVNVVGCQEYYDAAEATAEEKESLREAVGVSAVDETTIEFTLIEPQATFPIILSMWMTWPVPSHLLPEADTEWPTDPSELVFNGPFMVESYSQGQELVLVRNESYAGEHLAYLDRVTLQYVEDSAVANNAYRSGELDMAIADTTNLQGLQGEFPDELVSVATASTIALQMQMENEVLSNFDVRLALARAIDRETLTNVVLQGAHIPTTTWVPPDVSGVDTDAFAEQVGFNPEEAAAALERAGYPGGEGFPELSILIRDTPANTATAEFLQASFAEHLGIDVTIEIVDAPTRSQRFTDEQFELFPGGWIQDYPDAENWIIGQFDTEGVLNHYNCSDPEIDALIADARFNLDNEERLDQYAQVNELISTRLCGAAPLYHQGGHHLISPELQGPREYSGASNRVLAGDWIPEEWWLDE